MEYKYDVVRSVRKTLSVSVSPENKITVHAPWSVSEKRIEDFLNSKKAWLDKVVYFNAFKLQANSAVLKYKEVYVCGKRLPLIISDRNAITKDAVFVKSVNKIKDTFIKYFSKDFLELAQRLSDEMKLQANGFSIKSYKGKWGCCDEKRHIVFNYLLFMLPYEIQHYVIVHELIHTICFNHSPAFWKLVSEYEPDYKNLRKALKNYDFLIGLY